MGQMLDLGTTHAGVKKHVQFSDDGKTFQIFKSQDLDQMLAEIKQYRSGLHNTKGYTETKDMKHIGLIPMIMIEMWMREEGFNPVAQGSEAFQKFLTKKMNDPDYAAFRTGTGYV